MLFRRNKKDNEPITYPFGFTTGEQPATRLSNRALVCALKGFIIFAAACGTIGGVISSFSLPCYPIVIFAVLFVCAMALSFLHYNRIIFNIFYPLLFVIFAFCIFRFRYLVNSGYQAFLSIMQEFYSDYFDLSILREGAESVTNRSITISYAAVFIGVFLLILLNIAVSEYMDLAAVLLLTFPIFQLGIYIDEMPDFHYLLLLLFSYFMVAILKRSGHFMLPHREKQRTEFSYTDKDGQIVHRYHASGKIMFQLACMFLVLSGILGIICLPMLLSSSSTTSPSSPREAVDDSMEIFVQSGLGGFFNRYEATGGVSEGKLGGVSSVRPDYETDLVITFVPYAYETLYLKAYVGSNYTGHSWGRPSYDQTYIRDYFGTSFKDYELFTSFLESRRLQLYMDTHNLAGIYGKMKIENLDANPNCLYLPYYTGAFSDTDFSIENSPSPGSFPPDMAGVTQGTVIGRLETGTDYTLQYYPLLHDYWHINETPDEMVDYYGTDHKYFDYIQYYNDFNFTNYVSIPDDLEAFLSGCKEEIGYGATYDEQISLIQNYLRDNYTYDMSPGATPYRQDFVRYFLETQKRGYCAHFASAATLLLRSYGIPARYIEGYAVSFLEMAQGSATDEEYHAWFSGENPIGETGVISVDVTDADAHAWVEVYKQGIGWVPYEFTPPSSEGNTENTAYSDFWSLFSDFISSGGGAEFTAEGETEDTANEITRLNTVLGNTFLRPFLLFLSFVAVLLLLLQTVRCLHRHISLQNAYHMGNYTPLLSVRYQKICRVLFKKGFLKQNVLLPTAFAALSINESPVIQSVWDYAYLSSMMERLEKCCFSEKGITKKEADELLLFLNAYRKKLRRIET